AEQGPRVPLGDVAGRQRRLQEVRQAEQAQRVRDRDAVLAQPGRERLVREAELVDQLAVGDRLLERTEVGALDVLDQGQLERGLGRDVLDHGRDAAQAGQTGRAPAALASDQLEAAAARARQLPHDQRLQDAVGADRAGQLPELFLVDALPGLAGVGGYRLDVALAPPAAGGRQQR